MNENCRKTLNNWGAAAEDVWWLRSNDFWLEWSRINDLFSQSTYPLFSQLYHVFSLLSCRGYRAKFLRLQQKNEKIFYKLWYSFSRFICNFSLLPPPTQYCNLLIFSAHRFFDLKILCSSNIFHYFSHPAQSQLCGRSRVRNFSRNFSNMPKSNIHSSSHVDCRYFSTSRTTVGSSRWWR